MADWLKNLFFGAIACVVLAVLLVVVAFFFPLESLKGILPIVAMLLLVLGVALAGAVAPLYALYEVLTGKNETNWKLLWAIVVFFLGIIGVAVYM